ncbi:DUF4390 domain-containing protein [Pelistega europaea]|uniref:DUF4390 domain-containing protein n=1 Tax=Pelistega europaea TaxID=106147 RepID=A0A7Y4LA65_9BURK|nr:DUF4390 domain-containing protein [Pelistega europaea]NOL48756.1 DUF4390 domain-containing protein [Pelistega europaea]
MHYLKSKRNSMVMHYFGRMIIGLLLIVGSQAVAQTVSQATFKEVKISEVNKQKLNVAVDIDLSLSQELQAALDKGMPLFFTLDMKLYKPHQFWWDSLVYEESRTIGIRYNMLLREWRVSQNNTEFREFSLDDAIRRITRLSNWSITLTSPLEPNTVYEGKIRLRLDTSLLARPFQITALNNSSAWSFSSSWQNFIFSSQRPN